jgi:diaminopimelate decarboxylase
VTVRPHLPSAIASAIERAGRPTLLFDREALATNMRRVAQAARASGIRALFAAKSFAHADVLAMAGELLDGFDVASPGELAQVSTAKIVSIADPTGAAIAAARGARVIVSCETPEQAAAAPAAADVAIRVSASLLGREPAIGAVLDGSGRRRSRFGLDDAQMVAQVRSAAGARRVGLHVHHGPVTAASAERFIASAHAAIELAGFEPAFLDLGGAWHGIEDIGAAFASVRAAVPASIELLVEPGRMYARGAGYACGRVCVGRELGDRQLRVVDLSRACHLRWSQPELVGYPPRPGEGRTVLFAGPTCYEEDVVGEWTVDPAQFPAGARVVLREITGYAVGWNTGFGGVPPAEVVLV